MLACCALLVSAVGLQRVVCIAMRAIVHLSCSALLLCSSGASLVGADSPPSGSIPSSLAQALAPEIQYGSLAEAVKEAGAKLEARSVSI